MERRPFATRRGKWIYRIYEEESNRTKEYVLCSEEDATYKQTKRGLVRRTEKEISSFLVAKRQEKILKIREQSKIGELKHAADNQSWSVADVAKDWLNHLHAMGRTENTIHEYEMSVTYFINSNGNLQLQNFELKHADRFLVQLKRKDLSANSIAKHCRNMNILFRFAHEQNYYSGKIIRIRVPKVPRRQPEVYKVNEYRILEQHLREKLNSTTNELHRMGYRNMLRLHFLLKWTGLRRSEAHALMLDDFDLNEDLMILRCNSEVNHVLKNGIEQSIPLPQGFLDEFLRLDLQKRSQAERWWLDDGEGLQWYKDKSSMGQALSRAMNRCGIVSKAKTLHGYRATLGTRLASENPAVAQAILRHAQIGTTISHYVHAPNLPVREAMKKLKW